MKCVFLQETPYPLFITEPKGDQLISIIKFDLDKPLPGRLGEAVDWNRMILFLGGNQYRTPEHRFEALQLGRNFCQLSPANPSPSEGSSLLEPRYSPGRSHLHVAAALNL